MQSSTQPPLQRARRHDPYPWTWEIPLLVGVLLVLGLAVGVQLGRSLANLLAGAGWTWPVDQATFWRTIPAVAGGDAAAGLPTQAGASTQPGSPADLANELAPPGLVWTGIGIVELLLLIGAGWVAVGALRRWGPGRLKGMATRIEAEQMLGLTRLRKVSSIVRPDLNGKHASPRTGGAPQVVRTAGVDAHSDAEAAALGRGLGARFLPERTGLLHRASRQNRRERKTR